MNEKLLRYLLERRLLTDEQADALRAEQAETGKSIRELIMDHDLVNDERLVEGLSAVYRIPIVQLMDRVIAPDVQHFLRPEVLRAQQMIPFDFDEEDSGALCVAIADPMNMKGRDMLAVAS